MTAGLRWFLGTVVFGFSAKDRAQFPLAGGAGFVALEMPAIEILFHRLLKDKLISAVLQDG